MRDPTKEDLLDYLYEEFLGDADEFDCEEAIYWFAADWHSGQFSNLYSVLSMSEFRPGPLARGCGSVASCELYEALVNRFGGKR